MNTPIRLLLVDDDSTALAVTQKAVSIFPELKLVGTAHSGREAIELLQTVEADLVIMDVQMEEMNGFELARFLKRNRPEMQYIFISGHVDLALDGYEYQPIAFLTKPISISRLERSIEQVLANMEAARAPVQKEKKHQIGIHVENGLEIVDVQDVVYLEKKGRNVVMVCKNGKAIVTAETLQRLSEIFAEYGFFRCHQSFLVQPDEIKSISADLIRRAHVIRLRHSDAEIPLSRDKYAALKELLASNGTKIL